MNRAIFLDRDGTIHEDRGYVARVSDIRLFPETIRALQLLQENNLLFIVTNQAGIGMGLLEEYAVDRLHEELCALLRKQHISIEKIYCCPHTPDTECCCRKPKPFFAQQAARDFHLDLNGSYMIGDHPGDIGFGTHAGMRTVYMLTGHGTKHRDHLEQDPDFIAADLYQAAVWIREDKSTVHVRNRERC